ncbi:MAG: 2Fe-2S iron-sulfur cluster-binding protein, partial [Elusimicrobiota bacterium]
MNLTLKVWRQKNAQDAGGLVEYKVTNVSPDQSFLEMLDVLNEQLVAQGVDAVAFDSDCREGICGMCNLVIDGQAHGPDKAATTCQLHMRRYK